MGKQTLDPARGRKMLDVVIAVAVVIAVFNQRGLRMIKGAEGRMPLWTSALGRDNDAQGSGGNTSPQKPLTGSVPWGQWGGGSFVQNTCIAQYGFDKQVLGTAGKGVPKRAPVHEGR